MPSLLLDLDVACKHLEVAEGGAPAAVHPRPGPVISVAGAAWDGMIIDGLSSDSLLDVPNPEGLGFANRTRDGRGVCWTGDMPAVLASAYAALNK